jgi:uncharacterized membrane protein
MKMRIPALIISVALGLVLIGSAFLHFILKDQMNQHYDEVGFGSSARWIIGSLQLVAGICFLIPNTRTMASAIFCCVMLLVIVRRFFHPSTNLPLEAMMLFICSLIVFLNRIIKIYGKKKF